jgi:hypothetical protein
MNQKTQKDYEKAYYDVADALCRESTGTEDLCRQARQLRKDLAEARRIAEAYRYVWQVVSAAVDTCPNTDPQPLCLALMELQEAINDFSTIRSGPGACSGYIDDMARAKTRLTRAAEILADSLYKAQKRRAQGASTREMMHEIYNSPNAQADRQLHHERMAACGQQDHAETNYETKPFTR